LKFDRNHFGGCGIGRPMTVEQLLRFQLQRQLRKFGSQVSWRQLNVPAAIPDSCAAICQSSNVSDCAFGISRGTIDLIPAAAEIRSQRCALRPEMVGVIWLSIAGVQPSVAWAQVFQRVPRLSRSGPSPSESPTEAGNHTTVAGNQGTSGVRPSRHVIFPPEPKDIVVNANLIFRPSGRDGRD